MSVQTSNTRRFIHKPTKSSSAVKGGGMHVLLVCRLRAASMWSVFTSLCLRLSGHWVGAGVCKLYASARGSTSWQCRICEGEYIYMSTTCNVRCPRTTLDVTIWRTILHSREGWMVDRCLWQSVLCLLEGINDR